jgi:dienelactone hydrolase
MTTDITRKPLLHIIDGADRITAEPHTYATAQGPLPFDLYRPLGAATGAPTGAVVLVSGLPDPGVTAMLGRPLKDWTSYVDWSRAIAASGVTAIVYQNREPADVSALLAHLRANATSLGIDPARIGVWACSGHVPTALALTAREPVACAAFLYGYLLDLDGATAVADAAKQFYFATPPVTLDELPLDLPYLIVRAVRDELPGLDDTLQRFVAAARARGMRIEVIEHPTGPHAFDLVDDSPTTRALVDEVLSFLRERLGAAAR